MRFILVGLSRFARRRVLPAVSAMDEIETITVASKHANADAISPLPKLVKTYQDRHEALVTENPSLVYISLANCDHERVVRCALDHGHNVIVDKPGLLNPETAGEMVAMARSSSRVLAEATCYSFHPMYPAVRSLAGEIGSEITKAVAVFTPPVPADDFRYAADKGGGALLDTGPYLASLGRVLWDVEPDRVHAVVGDRTANGLETSYSVLASYPGGRTIVGQFGFTSPYRNSLQLLGPKLAIDLERPFSAPPEKAVGIRVETRDGSFVRDVPPADSMQIFLSRVLDAVNAGSREFDAPLLSDARTLDRLVRAAAPTGNR
jgi:predicted dehydrogenase